MDAVKVVAGGTPQRFPWNVPGQNPTYSTVSATTVRSQPIPKDTTYSTFQGYLRGTSGVVSATLVFYVTDDYHTGGADDPTLGTRNNFQIGTTITSTTITSAEGLFRPDMDGDEVYAVGVPYGTTMAYVSATSATLAAAATATGTPQARFQALNWVTLGTLSLTGTKIASDGFATASNWKFVSVTVASLTGTGAVAFAVQGN